MRTVVCILGQLRHTDITWTSFKRHVIDVLKADLVICGPDSEDDNQYTKNSILNIKSIAKIAPEASCNADAIIQHRKNLFKKLPRDYDQYILTRSDHMWTDDHPLLDNNHIWFMNCEFHFGISDRHTVIPKKYLSDLTEKLDTFDHDVFPNIESYLYFKIREQGLWCSKIGLAYFPMFLTDNYGNYRRPDEKFSPKQNFTGMTIKIDHGYLSPNGMYCGRVIV